MSLKVLKSTEITKRYLKNLYYGEYGSGKTVDMLTYPRVFAIDTEGRLAAYAGRDIQEKFSIQPFDFVLAQTIPELKEALGIFRADGGKNYDTLGVDSISSFYYDSYAKWAKRLEGKNDNVYTKVNAEMREIMGLFVNINAHIVMTARITEKYKSTGGYFESIGDKPDSDKSIGSWFDYIVKLDKKDHSGTMDKQTGYEVAKYGEKIKNPGFALFQKAIEIYQSGSVEAPSTKSPEEIIRENEQYDLTKGATDSFQTSKEVAAFCQYWQAQTGAEPKEILGFLAQKTGTKNVKGFKDLTIKISDAQQIMLTAQALEALSEPA